MFFLLFCAFSTVRAFFLLKCSNSLLENRIAFLKKQCCISGFLADHVKFASWEEVDFTLNDFVHGLGEKECLLLEILQISNPFFNLLCLDWVYSLYTVLVLTQCNRHRTPFKVHKISKIAYRNYEKKYEKKITSPQSELYSKSKR